MQRVKKRNRPICWLSGPAGSGKSAISQTVAERYAAKGNLIGSFFFLRGAGDRSSIIRIIPTLAYQLSLAVPATKLLIQDVIRDEPAIFSHSRKYQFKRLIVEPMVAIRKSILAHQPWAKSMVIVIDALDECDDKALMAEFIGVLIDVFHENRHLPLRVIVTSRVEEHIRQILDTPAASSVTHHLSLQGFDARPDIRQFFRFAFSTIYAENSPVMRNVPLPWPSQSDLDTLTEKSDGLFIFAIALVNMIRSEGNPPPDNLQRALTADAGLYTLYAKVLSDSVHNDNFERVIGTIMLLRSPLPITFLGHLLQLRAEHIVQSLLGIQSILKIPENDDQPIQLLHTSLRDFLTSQDSQPHSGKFFIDPPHRHFFITIDCLVAMMQPTEDIVYGGGLKYAGMNWCYHIHQSLVKGMSDHWVSSSWAFLMNGLRNFFVSWSLGIWINTLISEGWKKPLYHLKSALSILKVCDRFYLIPNVKMS